MHREGPFNGAKGFYNKIEILQPGQQDGDDTNEQRSTSGENIKALYTRYSVPKTKLMVVNSANFVEPFLKQKCANSSEDEMPSRRY